jgi:hypothetical protein
MIVTIHQAKKINHWFPIASWLIMLFQRTDYSHYGIEYHDGVDLMVLDATSKGVRDIRRDIWKRHYKITTSFEVELDCNANIFKGWTNKYKGMPYGFLQILGLALLLIKVVKRNPFGRGLKRIICNELVLIMLADLKKTYVEDTDDYDMPSTEKIIKGLI